MGDLLFIGSLSLNLNRQSDSLFALRVASQKGVDRDAAVKGIVCTKSLEFMSR